MHRAHGKAKGGVKVKLQLVWCKAHVACTMFGELDLKSTLHENGGKTICMFSGALFDVYFSLSFYFV